MTKSLDLTIIILSYNSQFWLKKTLETLKKQYLQKTTYQVQVVVVDNHSSDDSVSMVKKSFKWVSLIERRSNDGFAIGNNVAIREATSKYVMLLNSDVEFTPESNLDPLVAFMDEHPKVGMITPKLVLVNGDIDPACHRGEPTLWASFTYFTKLEALFPSWRWFGQYHQTYQSLGSIHPIDACSGAAMIVRNQAIQKVGLLDEQFFMYAEDLDWCKRFREAGYEIYYHPAAKLIHHKYKSGINSFSQQLKRKTKSYFYDTMLQYYDKHYAHHYPKMVRTIVKVVLNLKKESL